MKRTPTIVLLGKDIAAVCAKLKKVKYEIVWHLMRAAIMLGAVVHVALVTWIHAVYGIPPTEKDVWMLVQCVLSIQVLQMFKAEKNESKPLVLPTNEEIREEYTKFEEEVIDNPNPMITNLGVEASIWMRNYIAKLNK